MGGGGGKKRKSCKFSPKRDSLLEKLKQELNPETPGFRTLCPDETGRGVEIVVKEPHKYYVNSSHIYILFWQKILAFTTEILAQETSKMHNKTHSEAPINQNFLGGDTPNPPYQRGHPPLVLSPACAFCTRSVFRRTTFKNVATGLFQWGY